MSIVDIGAHRDEYQRRMSAAMGEKCSLFRFVPKGASILDYGSGAGDVAAHMMSERPDLRFFCFDRDADTVKAAIRKGVQNAEFFNDEREAIRSVSQRKGFKAVFMSSVIHEMVTSFGKAELKRVLDEVRGFDMVIVRDMCVSETAETVKDFLSESDPMVHDFVNKWGPLNNARSVSHFLLKSRYPDNWEAELQEDYFALPREKLLSVLSDVFPNILHERHFVPSFLDDELYGKRGRRFKISTHIELVSVKS